MTKFVVALALAPAVVFVALGSGNFELCVQDDYNCNNLVCSFDLTTVAFPADYVAYDSVEIVAADCATEIAVLVVDADVAVVVVVDRFGSRDTER